MLRRLRNILNRAGPGIITGASDDDPSGILTYLQSGVVLGFRALWTALFTLPLMYAVQEMCARIGFVSNRGIISLIKERYPKIVTRGIVFISVVVIMANIGADLLAIGIILDEFFAIGVSAWLLIVAGGIVGCIVFFPYHRVADTLKWLSLTLLFYVVTVFYLKIDWSGAILHTLTPAFSFSRETALLLAAIFGTTISPYLFFWQASEEVEERHKVMTLRHLKRFDVTRGKLKYIRQDVFAGMFFSNVVTWFMIAGASSLGSVYGATNIATFRDASLVLRPILGNAAYAIFGLGIIGTGLLAIPVLAGSVGYILAEAFGWNEGLDKRFHDARGFYLAIAIAALGGVVVNFLHIDPVEFLVYTAVLYTLITPPILYFILRIANDREIMKERTNSLWMNVLGCATFAVMVFSAVAYLISLI